LLDEIDIAAVDIRLKNHLRWTARLTEEICRGGHMIFATGSGAAIA